MHRRCWRRQTTGEQVKSMFDLPSSRLTAYLMGLPRWWLKMMVEVVTGHNRLNGHLYRIGASDTAKCEACGDAVEDTVHFLGQCPVLQAIRRNILGNEYLSAEQLGELSAADLLRFLKATKRFQPTDR